MSSIIRRPPMGEFMYLLFFQLWCQIIRFQENEKETVFTLNLNQKKISLILAKLILIEWISGYPIFVPNFLSIL